MRINIKAITDSFSLKEMLHFRLSWHARISSRSGKTNKEMFIYVSEGMYFIQSFSIRPHSLARLLETMESEVEEKMKHIAVYRQQRFQGPWLGDSFDTSHRRRRRSSREEDASTVYLHFWTRYTYTVKGKNVASSSQIRNLSLLHF